MIKIHNLQAVVDEKEILKGINLQINKGQVHAIMGPNGSGKTTLAMTLMGHPNYHVPEKMSRFEISKKNILTLLPEERAKHGIFVSFQSPVEVTGVSLLAFLRTAWKETNPTEKKSLSIFKEEVKVALQKVGLPENFMHRSVNEGFSGGERKRAEIVQLLILRPKFAVLDEIDSGLDVDSLKIVAKAITELVSSSQTAILLITHYQRILHFMRPDAVHVLINGKIQKSGDIELVKKIEEEGYAAI
jgi:Fe-S cluster assembly ATP-binding protein